MKKLSDRRIHLAALDLSQEQATTVVVCMNYTQSGGHQLFPFTVGNYWVHSFVPLFECLEHSHMTL